MCATVCKKVGTPCQGSVQPAMRIHSRCFASKLLVSASSSKNPAPVDIGTVCSQRILHMAVSDHLLQSLEKPLNTHLEPGCGESVDWQRNPISCRLERSKAKLQAGLLVLTTCTACLSAELHESIEVASRVSKSEKWDDRS